MEKTRFLSPSYKEIHEFENSQEVTFALKTLEHFRDEKNLPKIKNLYSHLN